MFFSLVVIIILLVLISKNSQLSREIEEIKQQLNLSARSVTPSFSSEEKEKIVQPENTINEVEKLENFQPDYELTFIENFVNWFKENWLLKIGILLVLLGFGWFISYTFIHDWIGPIGRVSLGFISGMALAGFGVYRLPQNLIQGKTFVIFGSALVILTSYASRVIYGFYDSSTSMLIVFLVSAFVSVIAYKYNDQKLAAGGLVVAFLAPLLTHSPFEIILLTTYLMVVSLASMWLSGLKNWKVINSLSILGFAIYTLPIIWFEITPIKSLEENFLLSSVFGMCAVYIIIGIIGSIKAHAKLGNHDIFVSIVSSLLIFAATINFISESFQTMTLLIWMIIFILFGAISYNLTKKVSFFYVYALISTVFLVVATSLELEGSTFIYTFAFEATVISIASYLITKRLSVGYNLSALLIFSFIMSWPSIFSKAWEDGFMHDDFGILFVTGLLIFGLGIFFYLTHKEKEKSQELIEDKIYPVHIIFGSGYFLILIWLITKASFEIASVAITASLVIYTIIGIICYFRGMTKNSQPFQYYGAVLLILVITRLLIVDVWNMELAQRVVTFVLIGLLFISTTFIGNKIKTETIQG